ncbi:G-type lectin S-receptor-like serine/threonine-protein kinase At4g27290 isoform X2 [Momordica charantia]|uniref:Receptor-like serine/threonine-protein kinase n=1 Tax=Momordica charantia TaxID=3673 RepID=A0A6J1CE24_MOMCH|nr:G-type lectin S-receptor-like serine/threonine-protein kinase At4g27290 isoform X2 [Momordica charantia]
MGKLICRCNLSGLFFFWTTIALFTRKSFASDSIHLKAGESINGSTRILVSAEQNFVLGIFTPQGSKFEYLGIWYNYKNIPQTVVWVANRDNPLVNSSARLKFNEEGNIVLLNETGGVLWSSASAKTVKEPVVQLLDTGNLMLREFGSENYVWQSFDYPSDTLLPGMKLGWDSKTGLNRKLTSWESLNDPSSGDFNYSVALDGLPQLVIRKGPNTTYRGGPWYGTRFSGSPPLRENPFYFPKFEYEAGEVTYSYDAANNLTLRLVLNADGTFEQFYWDDGGKYWYPLYILPGDRCDDYGLCGDFGICTFSLTAQCDCMAGFEPKSPQDWEKLRWSDGCVRRDSQICGNGEGFKRISSVKLPDSSGYLVNVNKSIQDCEAACLNNCSCLAYGIMEVRTGGYGCVNWFQKLMDVRFVPENGQDLYVRVAASELDSTNKKLMVAISVSVASFLGFLVLVICFILRRRRKLRGNEITASEIQSQENEVEMPLYDFTTIETATNYFSFSNKIGEGGFGPVYKGKLPCGQEIAVKRLAEGSGQGQSEFRNEVLLISQLQHRNLVKLLGFCIHKEETLLVYEYMPNKSLDHFLFDNERRSLLNWKKRVDIIIGVARGLLYLHRDSRLRIIHRDLKVSNILLDNEMNPKISDFGMARMFGEDQTMTKTQRIVGTFGYMSPEYVLDGCFSLKSDIFSFGVILLEIISGMKNRGFFHPDHQLNLLGHAWKLWDDGNALELMDAALEDRFQPSEALRCIQVGLLCVQQSPDERPSMWSVLSMLESENMVLSHPERPGFYTERMVLKTEKLSAEISTSNEVTVTLLHGR